ncbi:glycerate kinase [Pedobacter africanus]|uniref:Glycerate kinase n=1 Tax=Pedobacter africanus TaxID=151894 RepID=A0ACC6L0Y6_9SPHI|nr:glycerate kinase [Pedobacter africanus]MDR6785024.1 glycerate kinase [Pedobacter africanus]
MHILIAPNAFKNSLTALEAAAAIQKGLYSSSLQCTSTCFPIADGGDGTAALIIEKCGARQVEVKVQDALGRTISSSFGLIDEGRTAVIEMAEASGLRRLKTAELNPMIASSYGTGQLINAALDEGVNKIIIAMGGSATVDGGCGILSALGFTFLDENNQELRPVPQELIRVKKIDLSNADPRIACCELIVLCDVDNLLLGPEGAAAVFGPQKGADATAVDQLDQFLSRLARIADRQFGKAMDKLKYSGTAGGAAAGLHAFINAKLVNGIEYFLDLTGFDEELEKADLLITGEGSLDAQTLQGKGPFGVAKRALKKNIPVIGLAGKVPLSPPAELLKYFKALMAIGNEPAPLSEAGQNTAVNLERTAGNVADLLNFSVTRSSNQSAT